MKHKNNLFNLIRFFFLGCIYIGSSFQTLQALELSDVVIDSISAHPRVKEKLHTYRQVLSDQAIAKSGWRPSVDLQASTGLYDTESPSTGNTSVDYDSTQIELSVTQNLFNGYDTTNQIEQTKSRASAALYEIYDTADNIALDAIQAFLEVIKQRRLYELATQNVKSHEGILAQIRERNNSGVGRRSQLQQTEGRVARAHASLIAQQNNLQDASTALHEILGRYITPEELVEPILPELPPDELNVLIDNALMKHPAVQVSKNNVEATLADYRRSKSTRYPNIDLRLASEWGNDIGGVSGDTEELSLVLNLTYNFYNGGADKANQQKRISAVHEQKEFGARVRRQIINTIRLAWVADESLTRQLDFLEQHIVKARETVDSYREEFFIGQRDLIDLLDAENELNTAQNEYTQAYYDALAARYRIFEGMGELFDALYLETEITENDFKVARIQALDTDKLPLPDDEDQDREIDNMDHCDNTLPGSVVNSYGCVVSGEVEIPQEQANSAPSVGNDTVDLDSNSMIVITRSRLLQNDSDADGDTLTIVDVGRPSNGRLAFNKTKNIIYRPLEGYEGTDSFTYTVSDGKGNASTATVTLNVKSVSTLDLNKKQFVNFKYEKAELTEISKKKVNSILNQIKKAKNIRVEIYTHTDSIGSEQYNQRLSERRAQALKKLLVDCGLDESLILAKGMGETSPIADNETKAGQAINRRGEFLFKALEIEQKP